jgi:hypothetical protein
MIFLPANQVATTEMPRLCLEGTNPLHLRYRPQPGLPSNARIYACWPEKARAPPPNSQCRVASVATGTRRRRRLRREPRLAACRSTPTRSPGSGGGSNGGPTPTAVPLHIRFWKPPTESRTLDVPLAVPWTITSQGTNPLLPLLKSESSSSHSDKSFFLLRPASVVG